MASRVLVPVGNLAQELSGPQAVESKAERRHSDPLTPPRSNPGDTMQISRSRRSTLTSVSENAMGPTSASRNGSQKRMDYEIEIRRLRRENENLRAELTMQQAACRESEERAQACEGAAVDASLEVLALKAENEKLKMQAKDAEVKVQSMESKLDTAATKPAKVAYTVHTVKTKPSWSVVPSAILGISGALVVAICLCK